MMQCCYTRKCWLDLESRGMAADLQIAVNGPWPPPHPQLVTVDLQSKQLLVLKLLPPW